MRIGVVMGGISSEREVSLASGQEIMRNLTGGAHEVLEVILNTKNDIFEKAKGLDFALLALHGKYGEDGTVQSILDAMDIPYSGCGMVSSALCMDKDVAKSLLVSKGIRTAKWDVFTALSEVTKERINKINYPVVVKPNSGGSSVATFICRGFDEVLHGVEEGLKVDTMVMAEEFLTGDEITVPVLDGKILPTLMIKPLKGGFFDYSSKYEVGGAEEVIITYHDELQEEIHAMALSSYDALRCQVYARVDFMLKDGVPYILEVNTLPGMTSTSLFPKSAIGIGLDYKGLLDEIIRASMALRGQGNEL
jgi:D-alanine-D-alanine ligase